MNMKPATGFDVLSDELLVCILSCLTLKEAVRTSVFSSRWRYLWQFTSGTLDFDYLDVSSWAEEAEFIRCVNQILELHQSPSIRKLFVRFPCQYSIDPRVEVALWNWISFAMQKHVKILQLDLPGISSFSLDLDLFVSRTRSPENFLCYLTSVQLSSVNVTDKVIEHIVSYAPRIENISVRLSHLMNNLVVVGSTLKSLKVVLCPLLESLKVVCPSLISLEVCKCFGLESLEIVCPSLLSLKVCECDELKRPEIVAMNLVSLEYDGLKLMDVHSLPEH